MAPRRLPEELRARQIDFHSLDDASYGDLVRALLAEKEITRFQPEHLCAIDPRNGERVVYSLTRARRPHDNRPEAGNGGEEKARPEETPCPVCLGKTTGIIDEAPLSEGLTFINKNLYPMLYPQDWDPDVVVEEPGRVQPQVEAERAVGMHLLSWLSDHHDPELHDAPVEDVARVLARLAALEEKLLHAPDSGLPLVSDGGGGPHRGFVGIIKNFGHLVGGSLAHGHFQIIHGNVRPRKILEDARFLANHGRPFARFLAEENPENLTVAEWGPFKAVVPYFMRRPLDTFIVARRGCGEYLHHLGEEDLESLAVLLRVTLGAIVETMPRMGKEATYNLVLHNGPVGELYVEILPYTQETGGYEHLGIAICQGSPSSSADELGRWIRASGQLARKQGVGR